MFEDPSASVWFAISICIVSLAMLAVVEWRLLRWLTRRIKDEVEQKHFYDTLDQTNQRHDLIEQARVMIETMAKKTTPATDMSGVIKALEEINGTLTYFAEQAWPLPETTRIHPRSDDPADEFFDNTCLRLGHGHWFARSYLGHSKLAVGGHLIHKKADGSICQSDMVFFDCRETASLNVKKITLKERTPLTCHFIECPCGKYGYIEDTTWHDEGQE